MKPWSGDEVRRPGHPVRHGKEGPAFVATINRVSALLTLQAIRQLNAAVDLSGEDPAAVAQQFLAAHGLAPASTS